MTITALRDAVTPFLIWWRDELAASIPERVRRYWQTRHPRAIIRADAHGIDIAIVARKQDSHFQNDRLIRDLDEAEWAQLAMLVTDRQTLVLLEAPLSYQRDLRLPRGSWNNPRRVIDLQLERLSPVRLDQLVWSWTAAARDGAMWATIAMTRQIDIDRIDNALARHGIVTPDIAVPGPNGWIMVRKGEDGSLTPKRRRDRRWMLAALALLFSTPLTSLAAIAMARASLQSDIATLTEQAGPKLKARADRQRALRAQSLLRPVLAQPAVSGVIKTLAERLPDTARLESLVVTDGGMVQLDISGADAATLEAALVPAFRDVQVIPPIVQTNATSDAGSDAPAQTSSSPNQRIRVEVRP